MAKVWITGLYGGTPGKWYIKPRGNGWQLFQEMQTPAGSEAHPLNLLHISDVDANFEDVAALIVSAPELERQCRKLKDAANWVLHLHHGISKNPERNTPSEEEWGDALDALQKAIESKEVEC